jgi:hypothetical protein
MQNKNERSNLIWSLWYEQIPYSSRSCLSHDLLFLQCTTFNVSAWFRLQQQHYPRTRGQWLLCGAALLTATKASIGSSRSRTGMAATEPAVQPGNNSNSSNRTPRIGAAAGFEALPRGRNCGGSTKKPTAGSTVRSEWDGRTRSRVLLRDKNVNRSSTLTCEWTECFWHSSCNDF